jgi:DMSO/TMAO reductase YedYZ molybdopterin-dependent catalytic subunit
MNIFKRFVIISMLLDFIVLTTTGIIKFPEIQKYFLFVYDYFSASTISLIHDWSGLILILLIITHLILKRQGLKEALTVGSRLSKGSMKIIYIIIGVILIFFIAIYFNTNFLNHNKPIQLSGVEITEYQGEKLGSINDFRENSIKGPQYVDKNKYNLEITGLVETTKAYSYDDILKLPLYQKVVTLNCVEGWSVKALWEGVLIKDLLKNLTIKPEAKTIIFYAADGYSTSFPLDYVIQNNIIMASKLNGVELPPERGFPFQLVAEQKWGYKWIKWITKIELSSDTNYKGFWESRGYNNNGDLNGSKFSQ